MGWDISTIASVMATATNVLMYLSGMQIIFSILKRKSSKGFDILPFISCLVSCVLWTKYGLLAKDSTVFLVSFVGAILEAVYTGIFYIYSKHKMKLLLPITGLLLFMFSVLAYTKYITMEGPKAVYHHGVLCSAFNVFNYAAPLSSAAAVIRRKTTEHMSFALSLLYFLNALQWYFYGYLHKDFFIKIPNFIGIIFGGFQLCLFLFFPPSKSRAFTKSGGGLDSSPPRIV